MVLKLGKIVTGPKLGACQTCANTTNNTRESPVGITTPPPCQPMDSIPVARPARLWKSKADFFKPFRNAAASTNSSTRHSAAAESLQDASLYFDPASPGFIAPDPDLEDLNNSLAILIELFPDVQPEVFREMLVNISAESRLQLVAEHLLQRKAKWLRGRYRPPPVAPTTNDRDTPPDTADNVPGFSREVSFRSADYREAVKQVLYQEFRSLSHSTIKAVLAEQNFSYTLARPVLQQVVARSWQFSISSLWSRRSTIAATTNHPFIIWKVDDATNGRSQPAVKKTGSLELDREIYELFVAEVAAREKDARLVADFAVASQVNEAEAAEADALFDCECCYGSYAFEEIATCDYDCHVLCFECVRRTINEALYGQGWARTADLHRSSVRCFTSTSQDCGGCLPPDLVRRALQNGSENEEDHLWHTFQTRISSYILTQSRLPLQRCPFCDYAEVDETPSPTLKSPSQIWHHIATRSSPAFQIVLLSSLTAMTMLAVPILAVIVLSYVSLFFLPRSMSPLSRAWSRVYRERRNLRFTCRNPGCRRVSCVRCTGPWRDPHTCFESEKTSLRTAIEASATAAVKRTCPRCFLNFVKSSGCNKLVCNCGYTMCYICRQEISSREGYSHFCQHFRPHGGRCVECDRCDLYGDEDEEVTIRRAVAAAEKAWREKEGAVGDDVAEDQSTRLMIEELVGHARSRRWFEVALDAIVDACMA